MRPFLSAFVLLTTGLLVHSRPAQLTGCSVSNDIIPLPAGQTTLTAPPGVQTVYIAAGVGTQNYSCSAAGTYSSIGAVADLFDASCFYQDLIQSSSVQAQSLTKAALGSAPLLLGQHYFVTNPLTGVGISPKFDFSSASQKGNPEAFVVLSKKASLNSPTDPTQNIAWLELQAMPGQGDLAGWVYRIETHGGQPPASCTPGSAAITVPYEAIYWFFN